MSNTSYFQGASNCPIQNLHLTNPGHSRGLDEAFKHLCDKIAANAAHNSAERHDAPKCHEDTRKAVQEEIHGWINDGDDDTEPMKILYLTGPAGTGKTAIAGSVSDTCDEEGLLAGSFFYASFVASETRRSKRYLVATLAYHLISPLDEDHPLRRAVLSAVRRDRLIFTKRLKDQFKFLLIKPLDDTRLEFDTSILPKVFIIDGLDEVEEANSRQPGRDPPDVRLENEADQEEILSALLYAANSSAFPFRIIVASRPERVIETFFRDHANHVTRKIFLGDKYDPDSDITLFLNAKFTEIRRRYRLHTSWPSEEDIRRLVHNASGQFIYAATVIRFLQSGKLPNPKALLDRILDQGTANSSELGALAPLDLLYTRILESSPNPSLAVQWFYVIDDGFVRDVGALFANQLLEDEEGQAEYLLENLASLVWILPEGQSQSGPGYYFYHKSLLDFLNDRSRCGERLGCAFAAGEDFLTERHINIFLNKSPTVMTSESQKKDLSGSLCLVLLHGLHDSQPSF
ncbi:hypothetical protein FA13DRAFT_379556 [Coprinellus micaceus]|uniref:Nephrocystin 3-like N-terminal domain-containing protein n=1 Tax=Coprinellus micaceus TaxID=71717 RepID=A0A4Y7SEC1_COPMI|nr:hypothetical protein FA13DRAFT_379556 [Coprinellus micaceus]